jgi:hypothetical protein
MKRLYLAPLLAISTFLSGCAGPFSVPDTTIVEQGSFGPIQGTVYGGHAPLVGAHVYVLQPGSGSIGARATSILGISGTTAASGFPFQTNPASSGDPNIPAGWRYIVTDATGSFNLTGAYACTSSQPVYLYAYGGTPTTTTPAGPINPAAVNLATLGLCPGAGNFQGNIFYVYMNEVSTVATAYAFQGFTSSAYNDATHIGYSGKISAAEGLKGIQNAANNTLQLYDVQGSVLGHNANYQTYNLAHSAPNYGPGIVPQETLDTLADILAACVDSPNTTSPPSTGSTCGLLFATATGDGTTTNTASTNIPTDTATAAINIARHPAGVGNTSYASNLFNLFTSTGAPFSPILSVAPPDFTVGIQFPSSANTIFASAQSIATDSSGNFWFTSQVTAPNPPATSGSGYIAEGSPLGTILHSNLVSGYAEGNLVIDSSQNAWAGTAAGVEGPIYEDGPSTGYVFTTDTISFTRPEAPVADNSGNLYMVHGPTCPTPDVSGCSGSQSNPTFNEVTGGASSGTSCDLGPTPITIPAVPANCSNGTGDFYAGAYVTHAAIDGAGYIWMTSDTPIFGNTIVRINKTNGLVPNSNFPINSGGICLTGLTSPEQPAIDAAGYAWVPVYGNGLNTDVFVINPTGTTCTFPHTGRGPYGAAVDGVSNVWITNRTDATLTGLNYTTGTALNSTNLQPQNDGASLLADPMNIAIDISGDAFITNFGGNSIVEIIGLTTPVYGPLGVAAGTLVSTQPQIGATP